MIFWTLLEEVLSSLRDIHSAFFTGWTGNWERPLVGFSDIHSLVFMSVEYPHWQKWPHVVNREKTGLVFSSLCTFLQCSVLWNTFRMSSSWTTEGPVCITQTLKSQTFFTQFFLHVCKLLKHIWIKWPTLVTLWIDSPFWIDWFLW